MKFIPLVPLVFFVLIPLVGDSIVPQDFQGHLQTSGSLIRGDVLLVEITQDLKLKLSSSRSSSNFISFELTGGDGPDFLSFLPAGQTSRSRTLKSEEEVQLSTKMPVQITDIGSNGIAEISGSRSVAADGGTQELTLAGSIALSSITKGKAVPFDEVLNARLTYTYITEAGNQRLTRDDFAESSAVPMEGETADGTAAVPEQPLTETVAGELAPVETPLGSPESLPPIRSGYTLTDERKKELFMQYMNEFMRLIFM